MITKTDTNIKQSRKGWKFGYNQWRQIERKRKRERERQWRRERIIVLGSCTKVWYIWSNEFHLCHAENLIHIGLKLVIMHAIQRKRFVLSKYVISDELNRNKYISLHQILHYLWNDILSCNISQTKSAGLPQYQIYHAIKWICKQWYGGMLLSWNYLSYEVLLCE